MIHFVVAICTAKRPKMLAAALKSLINLSVPQNGKLTILIVENDDHATSSDVVEELRPTSPFPIIFFVEPKIGIPFARNRTLEEAVAIDADWIALVDDDEIVPQHWLVTLHAGCLRYSADVATGPVEQVVESPPNWWRPISDSRKVTGVMRADAYTNNVLFAAQIAGRRGLNLRFDTRFTSGGEDVDFFRRASARGARIVTVAEAKVIEIVPATRLVLRRHLQRNYMIAQSTSLARVNHQGRLKTVIDRLPGVLRRLLVSPLLIVTGFFVWPIVHDAGEKIAVRGLSSLVKALGTLSGLFGIRSNYYNRIDST